VGGHFVRTLAVRLTVMSCRKHGDYLAAAVGVRPSMEGPGGEVEGGGCQGRGKRCGHQRVVVAFYRDFLPRHLRQTNDCLLSAARTDDQYVDPLYGTIDDFRGFLGWPREVVRDREWSQITTKTLGRLPDDIVG